MKIEVLPNGFTRTTYDNGEVWDLAPNPFEGSTMTSPQEKMTVKFEIFDFGTATPQAPDSEKLIEMFKKYKEEVPKKNSSRFGIPFFKGLEIFLEDYGFQSTPLPWRYQSDRYTINQVEDSDGNDEVNPSIYTISITADEEQVYRGKLFNSTHAAYIFGMVAEHRYLTGKDDFPKLPIEPVKFEVTKTSNYGSTREEVQEIPAAIIESTNVTYGNGDSKIEYRASKYFHTAQELLDYAKLVTHELVISNRTNMVGSIIGDPRLEIYDDYRE